jgi:hypothetical protein
MGQDPVEHGQRQPFFSGDAAAALEAKLDM